ncbi:MAG: hypothetical protein ACW97A_10880, partial [Candidatus Thorarchaeota archaeon]
MTIEMDEVVDTSKAFNAEQLAEKSVFAPGTAMVAPPRTAPQQQTSTQEQSVVLAAIASLEEKGMDPNAIAAMREKALLTENNNGQVEKTVT